jgi:GAF domain-containing protein
MVLRLVSFEREAAFGESDVRLLETLASSLSVALENARLFGETKRLLSETEQRAAELAVINSVQQGLAAQLDMQAIYDLVGDKIRDIFDAQVVMIFIYDRAANLLHRRYISERGQRLTWPSSEPGGPSVVILQTRQPLLVNDHFDDFMVSIGQPGGTPVGEQPKSWLGVPLIAGDAVHGVISLQNVDREDAFTDADQRLLTTLASSMSVALENARLFAETQRLLSETEQRAAELSIINSVGQALAAQLDPQAVFDLVGERIRETFDAQVVMIVTYDRQTNLLHYPYMFEKGERFSVPPDALDEKGFAPAILRTR